jgi:hypothetical protein
MERARKSLPMLWMQLQMHRLCVVAYEAMYDPSRPAAGSRVDMCDGEIALAEDVAAGLASQDIVSPRIFSAQERGSGHVTCFFFQIRSPR